MDEDLASGRGLKVFPQVVFGFEEDVGAASGRDLLVFLRVIRQVLRQVFHRVLAYQEVASGRKVVRHRPSYMCCTSRRILGLPGS